MKIRLLAFILMISAAALFACEQQGGGQQTGDAGTDQGSRQGEFSQEGVGEDEEGRGYYGEEDVNQRGGGDTLGGQDMDEPDQQEQGFGDQQQSGEEPNQPQQQ